MYAYSLLLAAPHLQRTNYFFSVGKNVVATVSDFFTDEMENVTLDDDGVLTFSCNDKFCFAQLGLSIRFGEFGRVFTIR